MAYVLECLTLVYWVFFKKNTLTEWRQDIDPRLRFDTSPFVYWKDFRRNPKLKRYAIQTVVLSTIAPAIFAIISTLAISSLHIAITGEPFDFVEGVARGVAGSVVNGVLFGVVGGFAGGVAVGVVGSVVNGFAGGVLLGMKGVVGGFAGVAGSVVVGVLFGVVGGFAGGVAVGVVDGVLFGVVGVVAVGVLLLGVNDGVVNSVAGGVAFTIAYFPGFFRIYFWLPQVVWMLGLNLLAERSEKYLKLLPPNFDEITFLPLPFLDKILIETYPNAPDATRQQLAYLSGYTPRQKDVNRAIVGITAQTLQRSDRITDLIHFRQNLDWIGDPPRAILDLLPELRDISQDLIAASAASTPYRRLELLKTPIAKLEQLQANLKNLPSPIATQFRPGLNTWKRILTDTQTTWHNDAKRSGEIPAAYIAGSSLDPNQAADRFKGRQDIFNEIETIALSDTPPSLLLYGQRRTGKTSTLKYLPDRLNTDLIPLFVNAQRFAETTTLYGIARSFHTQITEAAQRSRNLTLPSLDPDDLKLDPLAELRRWFDAIGQHHRSKKLLLCIDEYERFDEFIHSTQTHAPLHFLRNTMQRSDNWVVLFSGSHTPDELAPYWSDYLIETQAIRLSYLRDPEARDLIVNPTPDFPDDVYSPDAITAIVQLTHGQPYYIQLICGELISLLNDIRLGRGQHKDAANPDALVTPALVEQAIPLALDRGQQYFREFWTLSLGLAERDVLTEILNGVEMPSNRPIRKKLFDKEIICMTSDGFKIRVPLIEIYCKTAIEAS
jgi:uncharacterized protein